MEIKKKSLLDDHNPDFSGKRQKSSNCVPADKQQQGICLVCGKELVYQPESRPMTCLLCGKSFPSHAACRDGHYVCDTCHGAGGVSEGLLLCLKSESQDPLAILTDIMDQPHVYMHGPEHHTLIGAALITAYANAGGDLSHFNKSDTQENDLDPKRNLALALREMRVRGSQYPGGACGLFGACGAAVSCGMAYSIITGDNPLNQEFWGRNNILVGRILQRLGTIGGPRCCKRNGYTALLEAVDFIREDLGVEMAVTEPLICHFYPNNRECLGVECPYFPRSTSRGLGL